jgi:hypothetical protein
MYQRALERLDSGHKTYAQLHGVPKYAVCCTDKQTIAHAILLGVTFPEPLMAKQRCNSQ